MRRSFLHVLLSDNIFCIVCIIFSLLFSAVQFLFPRSAVAVWPGYRVLTVPTSESATVSQLLADAGIAGVVSFETERNFVSNADSAELPEYKAFFSADTTKYDHIGIDRLRLWFFDESSCSSIYYIPVPVDKNEEKALLNDVQQALSPLSGSYSLELPRSAGSCIYSILFAVFAVFCIVSLRIPQMVIFVAPLIFTIIVFHNFSMMAVVSFLFCGLIFAVKTAYNDGFSPYQKPQLLRAVRSLFFICPATASLLVALVSGVFLAATALYLSCFLLGAALYRYFLHSADRRLHPRLILAKLRRTYEYSLTPNSCTIVLAPFTFLLIGTLVYSGFVGTVVSSVPVAIPQPVYMDSDSDPFSIDDYLSVSSNYTDSLDPTEPYDLHDYVARQWFERFFVYIPAKISAKIVSGEYEIEPYDIEFRHFSRTDNGQIAETTQVISFADVLPLILQEPLPPLEAMMYACGRFCHFKRSPPVRSSQLSAETSFCVTVVACMIAVALVYGGCFFQLYRHTTRQNRFFTVELRDSER